MQSIKHGRITCNEKFSFNFIFTKFTRLSSKSRSSLTNDDDKELIVVQRTTWKVFFGDIDPITTYQVWGYPL